MVRGLSVMIGLSVALALPSGAARAQYYYPAGYGGAGYGFGGWGGQTVQGSVAAGMGAFAAGAGQYNYQAAAANSINANTVMRWNTYMWASQHAINVQHQARTAAKEAKNKASYEAVRKRIRENPNEVDINRGDALNAILEQLTNPEFLQGSGLARATAKVSPKTIRNIPFRYAPGAVVITIDRYRNNIPSLLKSKALDAEREAFKKAVQEAVAKIKAGEEPSEEEIERVRTTGRALYQKVETGVPDATASEKKEALDYLKSLKAFLKMLIKPDFAQSLRDLDQYDSTTAGHLVAFMHTYNLRFGPATTTEQRAAYQTLYPILARERDRLLGGPGASEPPPPPADVPVPTEMFRGIQDKHLGDSDGPR